ncbi:MAG TPA: TonB-dependent receptor, partial [Labilithrix sp.]|nr:TonB-dependent receptor [Labilithrix sp.]
APVAAPAEAPAPEPAREPKEPAEVRVLGSKADALQRTPGSGTLVTKKEVERAAPLDLAEMLRRVPGVQARQEYGGGGRLDISVRGLDAGRSRRILMLEDGIPLAINPYSEPDMYFAPPVERMRGIEVVKGSGNILFGPQTLAGTINFLTLAPPDHRTVAADVDAGNYGYLRGLASYGDSYGGARYVVQVLHRRGDGFRDQGFQSTNGLAKVAFETGASGEATLKLGFHRDESGSEDVGLTRDMYAKQPRRATLSPLSRLVLDRYDASLTHELRFSPDTKLKTLLYGYITDRIWRRQQYSRSPSATESYDRIVGDTTIPGGAIYFSHGDRILDRGYGVLGVEPRFEHRMTTGSVAHTIELGGRVLRESAHYQDRQGDYPESYSGALVSEEKHSGLAFAGYLQDRIALRDDLLLTPGIRVEHFTSKRTILRRQDGTTSRDVFFEGSSDVNGFIPGVGAVYGTKKAHVFGGMHLGFAPPRFASSVSVAGVPQGVSAEKSLNYELGTRFAALPWLRSEVTGFLSTYSNQVIANTTVDADATALSDAGATTIYGLETGATALLGKALKIDPVVELGVRYTYSRATFRYGKNAGNLLPYAPEHALNGNLDVELRSGFGGQVAYRYVGPQFSEEANLVPEDVTGRIGRIDGYHVVDATLHYRHRSSGLTFRLTGKNLFDSDYIVARRPEGIFTGGYQQFLFGIRWDYEQASKPAQ